MKQGYITVEPNHLIMKKENHFTINFSISSISFLFIPWNKRLPQAPVFSTGFSRLHSDQTGNVGVRHT